MHIECYNIANMNIKKYLYIGIGVFLLIIFLAAGITAEFKLSNITSDVYSYIEKFFSQWSLALGAAGTVILALSVFFFIYENRRHEEREKEQAIHALHDEIHSNLTDIVRLRFQISQKFRKDDKIMVRLADDQPFQLIDTDVFDGMKNTGQLHWLEDIRMHTITCYKLVKLYNQDSGFKPHHLELLANIQECLDKAIRDLEAKFKFLPHYVREKSETQEAETGNDVKDLRGQEHHEESVHESRKQEDNMLLQWVRKYSLLVFGVVAGIPIGLLLFLAISFTSHSNIKLLLGLGFVCDSLAAATALYVALFGAGRKWFILAIEFFILGMFFKLFGLL